MMQPLNPYGVVAYTWINALGTRTYRARAGTSPWRLDGKGLRAAEGLPFATHWGPVPQALPPMPEAIAHHRSRCSQLFWASLQALEVDLRDAIERWGPDRVALVVGSSTGGIDVTERVIALEHQGRELPWDYDFDAVHPFSALLHMARTAFGFSGPGYVVSTACSSSGKALAAAQRLLEANACDAVVTGGADALCQMTLRGFAGLGILSAGPCRPFDVARDGINIGEGSALFLLERAATSPLQLLSAGESNDAFHTTAPHPEGLGARLAIESALGLAGLEPGGVDYVNAHGTGTRQNDSAEALALAATLGPTVAYSSTKDRVGHQLGAAGAAEAAFCFDALLAQKLPGNRPGTDVDPELAVRPLGATRAAELRTALSNSFAFGGSNVAVTLGTTMLPNGARAATSVSAHSGGEHQDRRQAGEIWVEAVGFWTSGCADPRALLPDQRDREGLGSERRGSEHHEPEQQRPGARLLSARARGRASMLGRLFAELFDQVARGEHQAVPIVFGSALGEMTTTLTLLDQMGRGEPLSPAGFQASVHNTAAGVLSIALGSRSFSTAIAAGSETLAMSLLEGMAWLSVHGGRVAVLVADEDAPSRLMRGGTYPAAGVGLMLHRSVEPPAAALGRLSAFERRQGGSPVELEYQRHTLTELDERFPALASNPAVHGVPLLRALLEGRQGRYAVSDEWSVQLAPAPGAPAR